MQGKATRTLLLIFAIFLHSSCGRTNLPLDKTNLPGRRTQQIPAGWFLMGENSGRKSNQPQRSVYLDVFEIQVTEVTRQDFTAFIAATVYQAPGWIPGFPEDNEHLPVVGVLWEDVDAYCRWLGMRLPTEAEWEKLPGEPR